MTALRGHGGALCRDVDRARNSSVACYDFSRIDEATKIKLEE